jgi:hypothetical protein
MSHSHYPERTHTNHSPEEEEQPIHFDSVEQEKEHWKDKYDEVRDLLEEARLEVGEWACGWTWVWMWVW